MGVDVSTGEPIGSGLADVVLFGVERIKCSELTVGW